jgi:hypothetical protein
MKKGQDLHHLEDSFLRNTSALLSHPQARRPLSQSPVRREMKIRQVRVCLPLYIYHRHDLHRSGSRLLRGVLDTSMAFYYSGTPNAGADAFLSQGHSHFPFPGFHYLSHAPY